MAKKRRKFTRCPNCEHTFKDVSNYCPNCGQENHDLNVPVKHLLWEFLEGTLHYDTKVLRTVKYLLFSPGKLTQEFNIGRRASYVPPFRLYVFISLVFFFVLALSSSEESGKAPAKTALSGVSIEAPTDSLLGNRLIQSQDSATSETMMTFFNKVKTFDEGGESSWDKVRKNVSFGMFILMPLFAYVFYLTYYRQKRNYVEHLMFAIHLHAFFFVVIIFTKLLNMVFPALELELITFLIMLFYFYLALKRVYKQSTKRTIFKLIPLTFLYCLTLVLMMLGALGISIAMS